MSTINASVGNRMPYTQIVVLNSNVGRVYLDYLAGVSPDKFRVIYDGVVVIDTGYVGSNAQDAALRSRLTGFYSLPEEGITENNTGWGKTYFNKPDGGNNIAIVEIYSPMPERTSYAFRLYCPDGRRQTLQADIDVENQYGSNITVNEINSVSGTNVFVGVDEDVVIADTDSFNFNTFAGTLFSPNEIYPGDTIAVRAVVAGDYTGASLIWTDLGSSVSFLDTPPATSVSYKSATGKTLFIVTHTASSSIGLDSTVLIKGEISILP